MREVLGRRPWLLPLALASCIVVTYLPSLAGGFLNYDDPWLIEKNALLADSSAAAVGRILFDLSREGRMALGAEYLPVRDLSLWLQMRALGPSPRALRLVQLVIYVAACLAFRSAFVSAVRRLTPGEGSHREARSPHWPAEAAAWLFALHPVHVESAAWLAGHKDVLALAFVGAALVAYAGTSRRSLFAVPALLAFAHFSKGMTVTAAGLLLAYDLLVARRPRWSVLGAAVLVALAALAVHVHVGSIVGMTMPPHGGSRWATAATMGVVWLRYLAMLAWPGSLSVVYDVGLRTSFDALSALGWVTVAGSGLAALVAWRKRRYSAPLVAWLAFVVPLLPVSQLLFPLQNIMADRYLFLSVLCASLVLGSIATIAPRLGLGVAAVAIAAAAGLSASRADAFADSVALFRDATQKTQHSVSAPYQLAVALESAGDHEGARAAYEEALRRDSRLPRPTEEGRRATNNLARLLVGMGDARAAEAVLRSGRARWPDDPKILANLVRVTARLGQLEESRRLFDVLRSDFPEWRPGDDAGPGR